MVDRGELGTSGSVSLMGRSRSGVTSELRDKNSRKETTFIKRVTRQFVVVNWTANCTWPGLLLVVYCFSSIYNDVSSTYLTTDYSTDSGGAQGVLAQCSPEGRGSLQLPITEVDNDFNLKKYKLFWVDGTSPSWVPFSYRWCLYIYIYIPLISLSIIVTNIGPLEPVENGSLAAKSTASLWSGTYNYKMDKSMVWSVDNLSRRIPQSHLASTEVSDMTGRARQRCSLVANHIRDKCYRYRDGLEQF